MRTRSAKSLDLGSGQLAFGSFLGEAAVDLVLEWIAHYKSTRDELEKDLAKGRSDLESAKRGLTAAYRAVSKELLNVLSCGKEYTQAIYDSLETLAPNDEPLRVGVKWAEGSGATTWVHKLRDATRGLYEALEQLPPAGAGAEDEGVRKAAWGKIVRREREFYEARFKLGEELPGGGRWDFVQSLSPVIFVRKEQYPSAVLTNRPRGFPHGNEFDSWVGKLEKTLERLRRSQQEFLFGNLSLREQENVLERIQNYVVLYREDRLLNLLHGDGSSTDAADAADAAAAAAAAALKRKFRGWTASGLFYYLRSLIPVEIQIRTMLADTLAEQYHSAVYKGAPPKGTEFVSDRMGEIADQLDDIDKEMEADFEDYIERRRVLD